MTTAAKPYVAKGMFHVLPFHTFGEAAAFGLKVRVTCRCRSRPGHHGHAVPVHRHPSAWRAMPRGPSVYIGMRWRWTQAEHSLAKQAHQAAAPIDARPRTYGRVVKRGEAAYLYDQGCVPPYTIDAIELDESPWDRFLAQQVGRFLCPGCRKPIMHVHHGPGAPASDRFSEVT